MSKARKNLTGQVFGNLTVLEHVPERKDVVGKRFWKCRCTCGRIVVVRSDNLNSGHSTQCRDCGYDFKGRKGLKRS
jgi:predicted SprT family Zn-dependent metalloprotease